MTRFRSTILLSLAPALVLAAMGSAGAQTPVLPRVSQVSHSGKGAYEASLTRLGDRFAVAWYDTRGDRTDIYVALLDASGRPVGAERRLTSGTGQAYEPDIQAIDTNLAVAWYEKASDGTLTAKLGLWSDFGRPLWTRSLSAASHNGRNPIVRTANGKIFVAWLESAPADPPVVWAQWFDTAGRPAGGALRVGQAGDTTWNLNAAIDDRGAWIVFDARADTRSDELFLARVNGDQAETVRLTGDDGFDSKYPDIGFSGDGNVALAWFDRRHGNDEVYLLVAPAATLPTDVELRARRVTETTGESIGAYLAWNGGTVGLAWCDDSTGQHEIHFQRFDDEGLPLGTPAQLTDNDTSSLIPAIRPWQEGFALVWNEFTPDPRGIHGPAGRSEVVFTTVGTRPR